MKNKINFWSHPILILGTLLFVLTGCPPPVDPPVSPKLTTTNVSSIASATASSGGNVTEDGGASVTVRGVCWNTATGPTTSNSKSSDGTGTGSFSSSITGLNPGITYYVKAYATNSAGTGYGNEVSFTTLANAPTLTTNAVSAVTATTATSGGTISADGGGAITARGVCWNIATGPTITNSKTTDGTGIGSFVSSLTGLSAGIKYYVRAYATNSAGTSYGTEVSFTALANLPIVTTTAASSVTTTTATSGGNVTADGGAPISARGVCWGAVQNPTTANSKTIDGTGTGSFTSTISGLTPGTVYYVKAYATNSAGTAYGNQITFTTSQALSLATVTTSAVTNITTTTATLGGNVTSDGNPSITERGTCVSTTPNPTTAFNKFANGSGIGSFSSNITGFTPNTTYYIRAYAINSQGTAYGNEVSFKTTATTSSSTVTDIDGNVYKTVTIGTQVWMAENLKATKFNDGSSIQLVTDNAAWIQLKTPGYSWYDNNANTYKNTYGALYNWATVGTGKLCPIGWHVPSHTEWSTLTTFLGGQSVAGGKLKEAGTSHWTSPNTDATNISGFIALPGGYRSNNGTFVYIGIGGNWWTSTYYSQAYAYYRTMFFNYSYVESYYTVVVLGYSVRCVMD